MKIQRVSKKVAYSTDRRQCWALYSQWAIDAIFLRVEKTFQFQGVHSLEDLAQVDIGRVVH